jgi:hypothetical protein
MCASTVSAQHKVKETIFENCDEARKSFVALSPVEQQQTFDFLTRIVALNTQTPASPEVFPIIPGQQPGTHLGPSLGREAPSGHMWQATDAKRELRAKRCALELFLAAGVEALTALPDLIKVYSEQNLSDEVAVALEETAANIAEVAHRSGRVPAESDIDAAAQLLVSAHPLLAQNYLSEFPIITTPRVVKALTSAPEESHRAVVETLKQLDPDGSRGLRAFLELARTLSSEEVGTLSKRLPLPSSSEVLKPYAIDMVRLAADPRYTRATTPLLSRTCVALNGLSADPVTMAEVAQRLDIYSDSSLSRPEQTCLIKTFPAVAARIALDLTSTDEAIVLRTLPLLPSAAPHLVGENRTTVFNRLKDLVVANTPLVSPQAAEAISIFTDKRSDGLTILLAALSLPAPKGEVATTATPLYAAAMRTVSTMGLGKDAARFTPILISAVTSGFAFDEARQLAKSHPTLETDLLKILPKSSPDATSRALIVLGDRPTLTTKATAALVEILRSGAHNLAVYTALTKVGASASNAIRRALPKGPSPKRLTGLSLLVRFETASKQEASELVSLLASAECSNIPTDPILLANLQNRKEITQAAASSMLATAGRCIPTLPAEVAIRLIENNPALIPLSCTAAAEKLEATQLPEPLAAALTEKFLASGACPQFISKAVLMGSTHTKATALKHLLTKTSADDVVLASVQEALREMDSTSALYFDYATVLAKLAPNMYGWKDLVRDAIETAGKNQPIDRALQVIRLLPPAVVLEEVTPALSSDSPERIVGGCHVGAALGAQAVPIVSKLWNLREKRHPSIRYATSLALLEINPLTPELQDALRQILVNRYFAWALGRPIRWQQTVALIELPKAEFGTLRTLHLERLITNSTAIASNPRGAQ